MKTNECCNFIMHGCSRFFFYNFQLIFLNFQFFFDPILSPRLPVRFRPKKTTKKQKQKKGARMKNELAPFQVRWRFVTPSMSPAERFGILELLSSPFFCCCFFFIFLFLFFGLSSLFLRNAVTSLGRISPGLPLR